LYRVDVGNIIEASEVRAVSTLKMGAACTTETSVILATSTLRYVKGKVLPVLK
jgi:hypothetical protein